MRLYSPEFLASLSAARSDGIAPVWFAWFRARDRISGAPVTLGLWSGDEDISLAVESPEGGSETRAYIGCSGLTVEDLVSVADLTDHTVTISMSQIAPAAQQLLRGYDARLAYAEIHATSWAGGVFASMPQLMWIGIVDEGPISTPAAGGEGEISLTLRSELMTQLQAINPAKSSDAHQKRRNPNDRFSEYAAKIGTRKITWFKG